MNHIQVGSEPQLKPDLRLCAEIVHIPEGKSMWLNVWLSFIMFEHYGKTDHHDHFL